MTQNNPVDLRSVSDEVRAELDALNAPLAQGGPEAQRVRAALITLGDALTAITEAKAKASMISADPRYNRDYKVKQIKNLVGDAYDEATRATLDMTAAREKAYDALTKRLLPSKPGGADSAMLAFQAEQAVKTLEAAGSATARVNSVGAMLAGAVAKQDQLLIYILAGGPVDLAYQRLIPNPAMLQAKINEVLGGAGAAENAGAAALLPVLRAGGNGTLAGLAIKAHVAIGHEREAYERWLTAAARDGVLNGIWEGGMPRR